MKRMKLFIKKFTIEKLVLSLAAITLFSISVEKFIVNIYLFPPQPPIDGGVDKPTSSDQASISVCAEIPTDAVIQFSADKNPVSEAETDKQRISLPEDSTNNKHHDNSMLKNGIPSVGFLASEHDTDIRTFILDYPSAVNIAFMPSAKDSASYKLTIRNVYDSVLTQKNIDGDVISSNTGNLYLRAGTYSIEVAKLYSWNGKPYTLTLNTSHIVNMEEETNDTISTANIIPLNENIRASTGTRRDIDYFIFTLAKTASVCPRLEFDPVKNYSLKLYKLKIENLNSTYSKDFTFRGDAKTLENNQAVHVEAV